MHCYSFKVRNGQIECNDDLIIATKWFCRLPKTFLSEFCWEIFKRSSLLIMMMMIITILYCFPNQ